MIKALILYYLSLKPTHGYEIQKFIQINHMDSWTKIQSGSIYYALGKLEKEGLITLQMEEKIGAKIRKIYGITDKGREELKACVKEELNRSIYETGSDKFIIYPILESLDKKVITEEVTKHVHHLRERKKEQEKWQKLKLDQRSLKVESICFEMMISSLDYQIKWHEAFLEELDQCLAVSGQMAKLIKHVDFSTINDMSEITKEPENDEITKLKEEILSHPEEAAGKLEQLIQLLQG